MKLRMLILLALFIVLLGCGNRNKKTGGKPQNTDKQAVMVEELALQPLNEYLTVSGKLEGITDLSMSSETAGRILQLNKKLGDSVKRGERIGMVENDVTRIRLDQAEAALNSAQASLDNAQKNLNFAENSRAKNLISEAEYNTAVSAFKGAKAAFDGAKAGFESAKLAYNNSYLIAPESGIISNLNVVVGQYINPGTPIVTITDASTLILKTGIGESQITKIKKGQLAEISHDGKVYTGKVRGFGIRPLPNSANYPLEIELSGRSGLLPGMVVSAKIQTNRYNDLLYTSITNILKEFDKSFVFVISENSVAQKIEVSLGRTIGENVELLSGVEVGDRIVTSGSENLEDGTTVEVRQ